MTYVRSYDDAAPWPCAAARQVAKAAITAGISDSALQRRAWQVFKRALDAADGYVPAGVPFWEDVQPDQATVMAGDAARALIGIINLMPAGTVREEFRGHVVRAWDEAAARLDAGEHAASLDDRHVCPECGQPKKPAAGTCGTSRPDETAAAGPRCGDGPDRPVSNPAPRSPLIVLAARQRLAQPARCPI